MALSDCITNNSYQANYKIYSMLQGLQSIMSIMCTGRCNVCICIQLDYKCSERTTQFISACYLGWGMYIYTSSQWLMRWIMNCTRLLLLTHLSLTISPDLSGPTGSSQYAAVVTGASDQEHSPVSDPVVPIKTRKGSDVTQMEVKKRSS